MLCKTKINIKDQSDSESEQSSRGKTVKQDFGNSYVDQLIAQVVVSSLYIRRDTQKKINLYQLWDSCGRATNW